ncbi:TetR/AcrR family transcriptional regulator [Streptomyces sp. NPDC089424]|uniref:TetR/AcrR family transcriptional regulator n=1 Tax=Streptomyces sp. NPDC089424 TaxID=3365917 RepID=UPI003800AD28
MDQLCTVANVSKRTLYAHFAGKDDLVHACLSGLQDELLPEGSSSAQDGPGPREQLLAVFDRRPDVSGQPLRGCPFLGAAVEIPDPEHPAHRLAAAYKTEFARRLADLARRRNSASSSRSSTTARRRGAPPSTARNPRPTRAPSPWC